MNAPGFWQDQQHAKSVSQRCENLRAEVQAWERVIEGIEQNLELAKTAEQENDMSWAATLEAELQKLSAEFAVLERAVLFTEPYDQSDAIVMIHAGAGGTEAQDWAEMLQRMVLRYCEKRGFTTRVDHQSRGQEAGIKSVTFEVEGHYAYGQLKSEGGVHRLVRISPFDAEKMRHTSFALIEVLPVLPDDAAVDLQEKDLKIETMRAGGHGGQSVNTTDSAVRITHLPTGIVVRCQNERSQLQNKQTALKILKAKLVQVQAQAKGETLDKIRGEVLAAAWGNQIRSYVLQPYKQVKDHRTAYTSSDPDGVLDGNLDDFVESYLRWQAKRNS